MENTLETELNKADKRLPTMEQLQLINTTKASMILTEIQNGLVTKVKLEQITLKQKAKHELKESQTRTKRARQSQQKTTKSRGSS